MNGEREARYVLGWLLRKRTQADLEAMRECTFYLADDVGDDDQDWCVASIDLEGRSITTTQGPSFKFDELRDAYFVDRSSSQHVYNSAAPLGFKPERELVSGDDRRARLSILLSINSMLFDHEHQSGPYTDIYEEDPPLSEAYQLLSAAQRAELRHNLANPAVRFSMERDGVFVDPFVERNLAVLKQLEGGLYVGSHGLTRQLKEK